MLDIDLDLGTYRSISFPTSDERAATQLRAAFLMQCLERLMAVRQYLAARSGAKKLVPTFESFLDWMLNASPRQVESHMRTPAFARAVMMLILRSTQSSRTSDGELMAAMRSLALMRAHAEGALEQGLNIDGVSTGVWPLVGTTFALQVIASSTGIIHFDMEDLSPRLAGVPASNGSARIVARRLLIGGQIERLEADQFPELGHSRQHHEETSTHSDSSLERMLVEAFEAAEEIWPAAIAQVREYFCGLLPIQMEVENWNSASTNEMPYVLQLTFRVGGWPLLLAESIIHETSHIKLDMAAWVSRIVEDDGRHDFSHPWRPDPRPISGVLYGAHAFLSVMGLYAMAREKFPEDERVQREWKQRRREVRTALDTLEKNARFTKEGEIIFGCLEDAYTQMA